MRSGTEARQVLESSRRNGGRPDAVLLDLALPDVEGVELGRELVSDPDAPPIILVSAASDQVIREAMAATRTVAAFRKPFLMEELLAVLGDLLQVGRHTELA
jgi:DNA-binding response OmpR family regulator